MQCEVDADCNLFSDCCNCAAYPASGDGPEACPADCALDRCTAHGIESASCFAGQCIVATAHNCSPLAATCDSLPPQCSDGSLPSVGDNQCWTGSCIPAELCGWRPDCSSCGDDEVCFRGFNDVFGTPYYCAPRPSSCSDEANCACARQFCEALGFSQCADADDGIMQCSP